MPGFRVSESDAKSSGAAASREASADEAAVQAVAEAAVARSASSVCLMLEQQRLAATLEGVAIEGAEENLGKSSFELLLDHAKKLKTVEAGNKIAKRKRTDKPSWSWSSPGCTAIQRRRTRKRTKMKKPPQEDEGEQKEKIQEDKAEEEKEEGRIPQKKKGIQSQAKCRPWKKPEFRGPEPKLQSKPK